MTEIIEPKILGWDLMEKPGDQNCFDYYLTNTKNFGDYNAFICHGKNHLRSELISDIEALAVYFKKDMGLKAGDVYTIFMPTNVESIIIYMALNKIGVIVNFVHPLLPPDNLKEIMDETGSKGIAILDLFLKGYATTIKKQDVPCLVCVPSTYALPDKYAAKANPESMVFLSSLTDKFEEYPQAIGKHKGEAIEGVKNCSANVAAYMNGGGTTGKSKTIKLTNNNLNYIVYTLCGKNVPVNNRGVDTEICAMPFFHAFGFCTGGLTTLHKGAKAIFMPKFDADQFIDIMKNNPVTEFNGVPNMYKKLLDNPNFDGPHLKNMRVMFSGGDDLRPAFIKKFTDVMKKNGSDAQICQGYGLTECCAVCTNNVPWHNKVGSIGTSLPMLTIEIWDENNKKVPTGEIGQMVMSGPTIMEGYLTKDGAKDEGLYTDENGRKWVLSGDLGYYDDEDFLYFVGRTKRVIIISGYNVYPADIEKLMTEIPSIKECCAVQGVKDDKIIVRLYVVKNGDADEEALSKQITDMCAERLSKFNIPKEIKYIDALPRTRVDKVDFMKLTEQLHTAPVH